MSMERQAQGDWGNSHTAPCLRFPRKQIILGGAVQTAESINTTKFGH